MTTPPQGRNPQEGRDHPRGDTGETRTPPRADRGGPLSADHAGPAAPPVVDTALFSPLIDLMSPSAEEVVRRDMRLAVVQDAVRRLAGWAGAVTVLLELGRLYPEALDMVRTRWAAEDQSRAAGTGGEGFQGTALNVQLGDGTNPPNVLRNPGEPDRNTTSRNTAEALSDRLIAASVAAGTGQPPPGGWCNDSCLSCQEHAARGWAEGYCYGYYQERGYSDPAAQDVPSHLVDDLPVWNPYDPTQAEPDELEGPPAPRAVTSMDCYIGGMHNPYADHLASECDRWKHAIGVPLAFVHLTAKDCE